MLPVSAWPYNSSAAGIRWSSVTESKVKSEALRCKRMRRPWQQRARSLAMRFSVRTEESHAKEFKGQFLEVGLHSLAASIESLGTAPVMDKSRLRHYFEAVQS